MKIPSSLKIGAHTYSIRITEDIDDCGNISESSSEIRLSKKICKTQQEVALIHEIFGACNPTMHDKNHELLASLAEQIYQVLHDNNLLCEE